jgi:D-arabinose 1-dehydrogenase-like Zn-dependent alcohol dehydrogenase
VPKRYLVVKVPDGIGLDVACMTACSGITAYNAVYRIKDHIESVTKNCGYYLIFSESQKIKKIKNNI